MALARVLDIGGFEGFACGCGIGFGFGFGFGFGGCVQMALLALGFCHE